MIRGILVRDETTSATRMYALARKSTRVGRGAECDIRLGDRGVSRDHAEIVKRSEGYVLLDHSSRNGTRVNGIAVVRRLLREGDRIRFGGAELVFREVEESRPPSAPAASDDRFDVDAASVTQEVTGFLPVGQVCATADLRAINAWQIVRSFGARSPDDEIGLLARIMGDVAGIRGMHRAVLYLAPDVIRPQAKWIRGGHPHRRTFVLPEARIVQVAETGEPYPPGIAAHSWLSGDGFAADPVCIPVLVAGQPRGALYAEGDGSMPGEVAEALMAATEAIGLGLTIRLSAATPPGSGMVRRSAAEIIGQSRSLRECVRIATRAGQSDATVLIVGESGTGKELFARLIYSESRRSGAPFVTVHSSAIEETLLGSALFGHEKGAFTGAVGSKRGLFEEADGGTMFLDEIGELSSATQVKLLRVLQEGEFMRLGGNKPIQVDVRVVAATNRDLEAAVHEGAFREDLYYRLKVIELRVPTLRERRDDIPDLVKHFIVELSRGLATRVQDVSREALDVLKRYDWPGNVRELRNVIERSMVLAEGTVLSVDDLPSDIIEGPLLRSSPAEEPAPTSQGAEDTLDLDVVERRHILRAVRECGGNKREAAKRLGISRSTLYEKLKEG